MSDLSPSQFETPGNPADTLPEISATQSPSGSGGRAETANNEGESILGAEERVLADEAGEGPLVTTLATAGHPTSGTWPANATVFDSNGVAWYSAAGGTPGTWVQSVLVPGNNLSDLASAATALGHLGGAPLASPTFTGTVTLPGNPAAALQAAPKQYVDAETSRAEAAEALLAPLASVRTALQPSDAPGLGLFFPEAHGWVSGEPADTAIVAAAAAANAAGGGTVWLSQDYEVDNLAFSDLTDVVFHSVGFSKIVGQISTNPVMTFTGCTNVRVEKGIVQHATRAGSSSGFGISVTYCTNMVIDDVSLSSINWVGVYFGPGNVRCRAANCLITNAEGGVFVGDNNDQISVHDNFIWGVDDDAIAFVGYSSGSPGAITRINCSGNTIWEGESRGIAVFGVQGGVVSGNTISTTTYSGIIIGNDVSYGTYGASGVDVTGNVIIDANTYNSPGAPQPSILVVGGDAANIVSDIHIVGNHTVGGAHHGIRVIATVTGGVSSISISSNRIDSPGGNGIEIIADVTEADILGNSVYHPNQNNVTGTYGIYNDSAGGNVGLDNVVIPDPAMTALTANVYSVNGVASLPTPMVVKLAAGQELPFTEFETSTGQVLASVDYTGRFKGLFSAYDQAALLDSPVGYWPLSDPAGSSSAQDLSGGAIGALTVTGGVTFGNVGPTGDPLETSALFDGTSGFLSGASAPDITGTFTMEAWVNHWGVAWTVSQVETIISDVNYVAGNYLGVNNGHADVHANIGGVQVAIDGPLVPTSGWHYLRAYYDGSSLLTLVMDDTVTTKAVSGAVAWGSYTNVGRNGAAHYFNGSIAKIGIYPSALPTARQTVRGAAVWKERTDVFTSSATATGPAWACRAEILGYGGGGAWVVQEFPITPAATYTVTVGAAGSPGGASSVTGTGVSWSAPGGSGSGAGAVHICWKAS